MKKTFGILICLIGLVFIMNMPALAEEAVTGPVGRPYPVPRHRRLLQQRP